MDDETFDLVRSRVREAFAFWSECLRLQGWQLSYIWERGCGPDGRRGGEVAMEVEADWRYLQAQITIYAGSVMHFDDDELADAVIHELIHCHVDELSVNDPTFLAHEERVVTCLTRAFHGLYVGLVGEIPEQQLYEGYEG